MGRRWWARLGVGMCLLLTLLTLLTPSSASAVAAETSVSIAAAADLVACLDALDAVFKVEHPQVALQRTVGSSGNFRAQIAAGAPFDVFMSADVAYPQALIAAGLAQAESLTPYGTGRIVLWTTTPGLDAKRGYALLAEPAVRKLAIANPAHAPYGRAAQAALERAGLWAGLQAGLQAKLVYGDNIAQAAQFVQSGNAQVGIVALSLVLAPNAGGSWWEIPTEDYPPLLQAAVLTNKGVGNASARAYLAFLATPAARKVFARYGFIVPHDQ